MEQLLGLPRKPDRKRVGLNHVMHWGQGLLAGVIRGQMAARGVRGFFASFMFTGVRRAIDQSLENATKVGAPPWTWPQGEQIIDVLHLPRPLPAVPGHLAEVQGHQVQNVRRATA